MRQNSELQVVSKRVKRIIEMNKEADIFHKAFLKPIEIVLKTYQTQKQENKRGFLPYGIKQVIKTSISNNKFSLVNFDPIENLPAEELTHAMLEQKNRDNMISMLKPSGEKGIKLAICICMYSEDKTMLKSTISGVSKNIAKFIQNGVSSNDIAIFVINDGIEVVHSSIEDFYEELEKENNIYLNDDVEPARPQDLLREDIQLEEDEVQNINHFIFNPAEFDDRKRRRFCERKKEYKKTKEMISSIEKMEKNKAITYQSMDEFIKPFFIQVARQIHRRDFAEDDNEVKAHPDSFYEKQYAENIGKSQPIIRLALCEAKKHCYQYIATRDGMALVCPFRVEINAGQQQQNIQKAKKDYEQAEDEDEAEDFSSSKMNLFMVTKYKNGGKLSSHNWFFNGFCQQFKPEYAVLLDVGLSPEKDALFKMIRYMELRETVGGVCGYMGLRIEKVLDEEEVSRDLIDCISAFFLNFVDIQRAQQMEYHFAHLIDKPFESSFDFIHVLPGAFSSYRMKALRPEGTADSTLLKKYFASTEGQISSYQISKFHSIQTVLRVILPDFIYLCFFQVPENSSEKLLYNENVYLAEDRTLCMGIHQNGYDLKYLPDAYAWVDPIKTLFGLLGQRKRWINGSFFAFESVKDTLNKSDAGDCGLKLQILYLSFMNMLAFVSPALFMFTVHIAMFAFQADVLVPTLQKIVLIQEASHNQVVAIFVYTMDFIYVMLFLTLVFFSMHLTNRHPRFITYIYGASTLYGLFSLAVIIILLYDIITGFMGKSTFLIDNPDFVQALPGGANMIYALRYIIVAILSLYAVPLLTSIFVFGRCEFVTDILFDTLSFIWYSPTYLIILNVYALCRIDDISWGTKGLDAGSGGRTIELATNWKKLKIIHVSKYLFWNFLVGFLLLANTQSYVVRFYLTFTLMIILAVTLILKVILSAFYMITYRCCCAKTQQEQKQPPPDKINITFSKVKPSLYQQVDNSIIGIEKECKKQNKDFRQVILLGPSMINKLDSRKEASKMWQNSLNKKSQIMKVNESMILKNKLAIIREEQVQVETGMEEENTEQKLSDKKLIEINEEKISEFEKKEKKKEKKYARKGPHMLAKK